MERCTKSSLMHHAALQLYYVIFLWHIPTFDRDVPKESPSPKKSILCRMTFVTSDASNATTVRLRFLFHKSCHSYRCLAYPGAMYMYDFHSNPSLDISEQMANERAFSLFLLECAQVCNACRCPLAPRWKGSRRTGRFSAFRNEKLHIPAFSSKKPLMKMTRRRDRKPYDIKHSEAEKTWEGSWIGEGEEDAQGFRVFREQGMRTTLRNNEPYLSGNR